MSNWAALVTHTVQNKLLLLSDFSAFSQFISLASKDQNQSGKTKLDRERLKLCLSEVVCGEMTTEQFNLTVQIHSSPLNAGICMVSGVYWSTS